jgi:hypothetical protein
MLKRLLLVCGLCLLAVPAAWAAHSQPLAFFSSISHLSVSVSQQPGVSNPTVFQTVENRDLACVWDAADDWTRTAVLNSVLDVGANASDHVCVLQDWAVRHVQTHLIASSPDLAVSVTTTAGISSVAPVFDKASRSWFYDACVNLPTFQAGDPALVSVPNSNGGVAVMTAPTVTIANPTSRQVAKIVGSWGVYPNGCLS